MFGQHRSVADGLMNHHFHWDSDTACLTSPTFPLPKSTSLIASKTQPVEECYFADTRLFSLYKKIWDGVALVE